MRIVLAILATLFTVRANSQWCPIGSFPCYFKDSVSVSIHNPVGVPYQVVNNTVVSNSAEANAVYAAFGIYKAEQMYPSAWSQPLREVYMLACNGCNLTSLIDTLNSHSQIFGGAALIPMAYPTATTVLPVDNEIILYPNPANEELFVKNKSGKAVKEIEVYNSSGARVVDFKTGSMIKISLRALPPGMYLIKVHTFAKTYLTKFIRS